MILCVTGPMAAGKNAASDILEKKGFSAVDADVLGHQAVDECTEEIIQAFGRLAEEKNIRLQDENGKIIRKNLGALIFADPELVAKQESIVYPCINRLFDAFLEENKGRNIVVNATVLYKVPLISRIDSVLFVDAPVLVRLFRARKRDKLPFKQILQRFHNQKNLFAKYKNSVADTRRVRNNGSRKTLERHIDEFLSACPQGI